MMHVVAVSTINGGSVHSLKLYRDIIIVCSQYVIEFPTTNHTQTHNCKSDTIANARQILFHTMYTVLWLQLLQ